MAKDKDYIQMIHTTEWLKLRKAALDKHPTCCMCEKEGRLTAAQELHHIRPVEEAITYQDKCQRMFDPSNVLPLCHDCHVKIHTELGRCGREATKRRNEKQVAQIIKKFFDATDDEDGGGIF